MTQFLLEIPGIAVAKGRPRIGVVNGHAMARTPAKTRHYEAIVRERAMQAWGSRQPLATGVSIGVTIVMPVPSSWPKYKQRDAMVGAVRPTSKPDLDNLVKSITDGLNGVIYLDDAQIWSCESTKLYGAQPGVAVRVTW